MKLTKYKLGEIAKIEISGVDKKTVDGEKSVRLCNFVDVYRNWAITQELSENFMIASAKETEIAKCSIHKGQVAITKDSETRDDIGIPAYIADDFDNVLLGYHCALITPNDDVLDGKYLNAFMHTRYIQKYFENNASGSGQRYTLSNETIFQIPILLPSLEVQKAIGNLLSNIDRKIELNRQINDNLEKMAKQLYDYWFVQFDFPDENGRPYKSSGREMVWNEKLKRKIPKDWYVKNIGDFANVRKGTTITKAQTQNGSIKVVAAATSFSFLHNEANRSEYVITISSSGANAGYINFWREPIFASDCSTVQGNSIEITLYCYYWLLYFQETLFNQQIGAAQPHVYPEHISKIPIVIPPNHILNKIKDCMVSINMQQHMAEQEIEELTKQRDELLPLLMNGQTTLNYHLSNG